MNTNRDVFSKIIPNIKLSTVLDADGKEIQVENREDEEQNSKQQEIYDILVAAGYFRARIRGLSAFDKIVGGMTWCIGACDYDVDVDLLFHENLSIGQKIALTEKIVIVLPKMKCPYLIEPHQIQGLDFIHIFPVIQWLVKRSVENRARKAERLKIFALGQFHNHFSIKSDRDNKEKFLIAAENIKEIENTYGPVRQYKRKAESLPEDDVTRVRMTLLEYGDKNISSKPSGSTVTSGTSASEKQSQDDDVTIEEVDVDQLLKKLYVAHEDFQSPRELTDAERKAADKHYAELKSEMSIDAKQLSEQSQIKALTVTKLAMERKLQTIRQENQLLTKQVKDETDSLNQISDERKELEQEIKRLDNSINTKGDKKLLVKIQNLVLKNEELKQQEVSFKEKCREEMVKLQEQIQHAETPAPENDLQELKETLKTEQERFKILRLQLAKKNRGVVSIQRQLDNIPDRIELSQYQRRFIELYNQVSAKHRETKHYFTNYNTLDDTKLYLSKELSLLNSIYDNYHAGMSSFSSREQYLKQLETIVDGVMQTKDKVRLKYDDEKEKRDKLSAQLLSLIEQQREYALAVKELTDICKKNEQLMKELNL